MKIIGVVWWATESTVGLVIVDTGYGLKGYIGSPPFAGLSEEADQNWIAGHGTRFHNIPALQALFPRFADQEWYEG